MTEDELHEARYNIHNLAEHHDSSITEYHFMYKRIPSKLTNT